MFSLHREKDCCLIMRRGPDTTRRCQLNGWFELASIISGGTHCPSGKRDDLLRRRLRTAFAYSGFRRSSRPVMMVRAGFKNETREASSSRLEWTRWRKLADAAPTRLAFLFAS